MGMGDDATVGTLFQARCAAPFAREVYMRPNASVGERKAGTVSLAIEVAS